MITSVVLVRPQFSGNLGSVARAMKNMGLTDLRLVEPEALPSDTQAKQMAAHAKDLLQGAKIFPDIMSALQGYDLVVGTSRRLGKERQNFLTAREFAGFAQSLPPNHQVAILFGAEDTGLTNLEVSLCQKIIYIPSHPSFPSLNIAQAVMIVCYELFFEGLKQKSSQVDRPISPEEDREDPAERVAKFENLEGMYDDLKSLLSETGFLDQNNPEHLIRLLRNLFNRARPTEKEVKIFRGICRQVRWWGNRG